MLRDKSEKRAREILHSFVDVVSAKYKDDIKALILVGSLSNGSYVEGPGRDIDIITVLKETAKEEARKLVLEQIEITEAQFNHDIPISRTIYLLSELTRPFKTDISMSLENKHLLEVTTELQRIHDSGILLFGENIIEELPIPSRDEIIAFDKLAREWHKSEAGKNPKMREILDEPPINILVQSIITNAFRALFLFHGQLLFQ